MSSKRIKFETSQVFKDKIEREFLKTLQYGAHCQIAGATFPHPDICTLQLVTNRGMRIISIYRDNLTGFAEYCEGEIRKYPTKGIK